MNSIPKVIDQYSQKSKLNRIGILDQYCYYNTQGIFFCQNIVQKINIYILYYIAYTKLRFMT